MVSPIQQIETLIKRLDSARKLFEEGKVHRILNMDNHFAVESSNPTSFWLVNGECGCPDSVQRAEVHKGWCKHKLAVELFKESQSASEPQPADEVDLEGLYPPDSEAA